MRLIRPRFYTVLLAVFSAAGLAQTDWQTRYQNGERLLAEGRIEEALTELKPALALAPAKARGTLLDALGRAEIQAGRYREAKRHFEASLPLWETHTLNWAVTLNNLGRVHLELHEYARAEEALLRSLEVLRNDARLWQNIGQAQFFRGRLQAAEVSYYRALSLAGLLESRRQYAKAAGILREAVARLGAGQVRARMLANLGVLQWRLKERVEAAAQLRQALGEMESAVGPHHPDVAAVLERYQAVLRQSGRKAEAAAASQRAAAIRSGFARHGNDRQTSIDWRDLK